MISFSGVHLTVFILQTRAIGNIVGLSCGALSKTLNILTLPRLLFPKFLFTCTKIHFIGIRVHNKLALEIRQINNTMEFSKHFF